MTPRPCIAKAENEIKPQNGNKKKGCPKSGGMPSTEASATIEHPNPRPRHYCELCGKSFKRGHNLKIHGRMHSGVTPYRCPYPNCGKEFRWKSSIVSHKKWHKYKCHDVLPEEKENASIVNSLDILSSLEAELQGEIECNAVEFMSDASRMTPLASPVSSLITPEYTSDAELELPTNAFDVDRDLRLLCSDNLSLGLTTDQNASLSLSLDCLMDAFD